jgi:hypothetical protein
MPPEVTAAVPMVTVTEGDGVVEGDGTVVVTVA